MLNYFWTHTIWYFILLGITIAEITFALMKSTRKRVLWGMFFTLLGSTVLFEIIFMSINKSYTYDPKILPESWNHFKVPHPTYYTHNESIIGNYFSQLSVSATAVLLAARELKVRWYVISILAYCLIEEWFLYLGIYKHNWYQTWMTCAGLAILFFVTKAMYANIRKGSGRILHFTYLLFGVFGIHPLISPGWFMYLLGVQTFATSWFGGDYAANSGFFYAFLAMIQAPLVIAAYTLKPKWSWHILVVCFLFVQHYILYKLNINTFQYWWGFGVYFTTWTLGLYLGTYMLDKLYERSQTKALA